MNSFYLWFQSDLDRIFLVYGAVFFIMGVVILLQPKKGSEFKLGSILWLLAAFAIIHSVNEFLDIWAITTGAKGASEAARWLTLTVSYFFLFEFGRKLFRLTDSSGHIWRKRVSKVLADWITLPIMIFIVFSTLACDDFWNTGSILARYLFCFPAGLLIGLGLIFYYSELKHTLAPLKVKKYFLFVCVSFLAYSFFGGLIVPKGEFFPANWLNKESFLKVVHMEVEVFRALCAVLGTVGVAGILNIFNWEKIKKVQDALSLREKITEGIDEAILLVDKDFKVLWVNKKAKKLYGKIIGDSCYAATHDLAAPCQFPHVCPIIESLKTNAPTSFVHSHRDGAGNTIYIEVSAYPVKNERGEASEFVHVSKDITERVRQEESLKKAYTELKKTQNDLIQAEKLAAVGRFSSGIAHEVKNPLAIILSGVEFLEIKFQDADPEVKKAAGTIKDAVFRADGILKDILKFSKPSELKTEKITPNALINDILSMFKYITPLVNIDIKSELGPEDMLIEVDKNQIQQVIFNALLNSIDAMPNGGEIRIKTIKIMPPEFPEAMCVIEITDTGEGISKDNLSKVFEPFFTTKRDKKGTGLGLSISRTIVNNHKGALLLASELGKGTTLSIVLPLTEGEK